MQLAALVHKEAKVHKTHCKLVFKLIVLDYFLSYNCLQHVRVLEYIFIFNVLEYIFNVLAYIFIFKRINCIHLTSEDSSPL